MSITCDPNDARLTHGVDEEPTTQAEAYLVLCDDEKPAVRPLRLSYKHVGIAGPTHPLRDLTEYERERWDADAQGYVKYEEYPKSKATSALGKLWTQEKLDSVCDGCGSITTMNRSIAETYQKSPYFYGATFCVSCSKHLPVGKDGEFVWIEKDGSIGPRVGT